MRGIFPLLFLFLISGPLIFPPGTCAAAVREQAPGFELPDNHGVLHRLSDFRGKVVVLNFWASWCPECVREMPSLNALYSRFKNEGLVALGISIDREWSAVEKTTGGLAIAYPVVMDNKGEVFVKKYTVTRLPATVIIDRDGAIVQKLVGSQDFVSQTFIEKMEKLLNEGK